MADRSFHHFLSRSLGVVERECSTGYLAVSRALGCQRVGLTVDGEPAELVANGHRVWLTDADTEMPAQPGRVSASFTRPLLRDLVEGRTTLLGAALEDRLHLAGSLDRLAAFDEALHFYFASAVRCPSFPALLDAFLEQT